MAIKKAWSLVDEAKERTENLTIEQLKAEGRQRRRRAAGRHP